MIKTWEDLRWWKSGEKQVIDERLDDFDKVKHGYNPKRENIYAALDSIDFEDVKVAFFGQDPYPTALSKYATGLAFSIPVREKVYPPTLLSIFKEYSQDLGLPTPTSGCLNRWSDEGVLLWNVCPTVDWGRPGSHSGWVEWQSLTTEITRELSKKGVVFVFFGAKAAAFRRDVDEENCVCIRVTHPSPVVRKVKYPFSGSRLFSTINIKLVEEGKKPIDWRL